jgi:hypothetical protein
MKPTATTTRLAQCNCAEVKDERDNLLPYVEGHDCEYIRQRNRFIGEASSWAQQEMDKLGLSEVAARSAAFNKLFAERMESLCFSLTI